jgi:uncharacterized delta-60 repeat protein
VLLVATLTLTTASAQALPGDLDPGFGSGGLVTTDFDSTNDEAISVTSPFGGKLLAVGQTDDLVNAGVTDFGLVRYNADGTLDSSFGSGGLLRTPFSSTDSAAALAVAKLPVGFVAAGHSGNDFAVARYLKDGSLDPSFDGDGKVTTSFGGMSGAGAVVRQTDGKIVAAGSASGEFALARYQTDGSLDPTFGSGGKVVTPIGTNDSIQALLLQSDGKLVAAGTSFGSTDPDFALARYNTDGTLDSTFGTGGIVTTDFNSNSNDLGFDAVLQGDGKIVVAGESALDVGLARYNTDGSLDSPFGSGGKVTTDLGADEARASGVGLDSSGNVVAGGTLFSATKKFLVLRYTPSGTLDSTFGSGGEAFASFGAGVTEANAITIHQDGKIVLAGHHGATLQTKDFALARFRGR